MKREIILDLKSNKRVKSIALLKQYKRILDVLMSEREN